MTTEMERNETLICNVCGRKLRRKQEDSGIYLEDFVTVQKTWGYFSSKDGIRQTVTFCEACFDRLCESLTVPPKTEEDHGILGV